jgi:hypothetical protein
VGWGKFHAYERHDTSGIIVTGSDMTGIISSSVVPGRLAIAERFNKKR